MWDSEDDEAEPDPTHDDEVAEWWAWHMAEHEPYGTDGPPLRAEITIDPGDYL